MPRATGTRPTIWPKRMADLPATGFMPICIVRKATPPMPGTGMFKRENPFTPAPLKRNGRRSARRCWRSVERTRPDKVRRGLRGPAVISELLGSLFYPVLAVLWRCILSMQNQPARPNVRRVRTQTRELPLLARANSSASLTEWQVSCLHPGS
jgi:hypothetical protein